MRHSTRVIFLKTGISNGYTLIREEKRTTKYIHGYNGTVWPLESL